MEVPGGHNNKIGVLLYEAMGAALLLITVNWSAAMSGLQPFAIGGILMINIQMFGRVSGAHFNPAVTLGVLIREGIGKIGGNLVFAVLIIVAQILGMGFGAVICNLTVLKTKVPGATDKTAMILSKNVAMLCPNRNGNAPPAGTVGTCSPSGMVMKVFIIEMICTFIFVSVICNIKKINGTKDDPPNSATVGATLATVVIVAAGTTGGCINPAVGLVQTFYQQMLYKNTNQPAAKTPSLDSLWIYLLAPALGGVLAGLYQLFNGGVNEDQKDKRSASESTYKQVDDLQGTDA